MINFDRCGYVWTNSRENRKEECVIRAGHQGKHRAMSGATAPNRRKKKP